MFLVLLKVESIESRSNMKLTALIINFITQSFFILDSDDNNKQETSTDTYIAGPESPRLSTIQEEDTISKSSTRVATSTIETTQNLQSGEEKAQVEESEAASSKKTLNTSNEKKVLKARRSISMKIP